MVEVAARLVDHVLPVVPARQWVLSVPKRLRPCLHHRPEVATGVLRILVRALRTTLVAASPGAPRHAQIGVVSFLHRFGASLNAHPHFHLLVLDGVFAEDPDGSVQFREATALTRADVDALTETVRRRILRYFRRHGILEPHVTDDMLTWQGTGGFSLDGSVRVEGTDRAGLERLVRYLARPPFALSAGARYQHHVPTRSTPGPGCIRRGVGAAPIVPKMCPNRPRGGRTQADPEAVNSLPNNQMPGAGLEPARP